ncbi:hypothetical protein [Mechercharimyces sp. CAU 1602]|uniref:hypothetical protein n=1 Tax=Mechercharimyces sp. CAU 1602 TaxID=2973933 RepID=UPI00216126D9|nr:hypothetical protein [Mechercharimyces sp. CAU 1602]MCS1350111.1 hypothetical protein [Mechercharimyces sp. CAU 1602]
MNLLMSLEKANNGEWTPRELFPHLAQYMPQVYVAYHRPTALGTEVRPVVARGKEPGSKRSVLFSDEHIAQDWLQAQPQVYLQSKDTLEYMKEAFRSGYDGFALNPGKPSRLITDRSLMHLLLCEYALVSMKLQQGAWIPSQRERLLFIDLDNGKQSIPVYFSKSDAQAVCEKSGGEPQLHSWEGIRSRCWALGGEGPILQYGFPEQIGLLAKHVDGLCGNEKENVYALLERSIRAGQGTANAWEIGQMLKRLDWIWVVVDRNGTCVDLAPGESQPTLDIFTNSGLAHERIAEWRQAGGQQEVFPRLKSCKSLFAEQLERNPVICINRGSKESWISITNDTLKTLIASS